MNREIRDNSFIGRVHSKIIIITIGITCSKNVLYKIYFFLYNLENLNVPARKYRLLYICFFIVHYKVHTPYFYNIL